MSMIQIEIGDKRFSLSSPEENHGTILRLSEKLDAAFHRVRETNSSASFEFALVIAALELASDGTDIDDAKEDNIHMSKLLVYLEEELSVLESDLVLLRRDRDTDSDTDTDKNKKSLLGKNN